MNRPLLLALLSALVIAGSASAVGPAPGVRRELAISAVRAAMLHDRGLEDVLLEVDYEDATRPFAWIIPLPAEPVARVAPAWQFTALAYDAERGALGRSEVGKQAAEEPAPPRKPVERPRGSIDSVRFYRGEDVARLLDELRAEGLDLLTGSTDALREYARQGWMLTVVRITPRQLGLLPDQEVAQGTAGPLRLSFASETPVFPLRANRWSAHGGTVRFYYLSRGPVAPDDAAAWEVHHLGPLNPSSWGGLDPAGRFPGLAEPPAQLTTLVSRIDAARLADPTIHPYAPLPDLASPDPRIRAEAASSLGWERARGAVPALQGVLLAGARLGRSEVAGEDVLSAIWALGEIGDTSAVSTILPWATRSDLLGRLEAEETLRRLGTKRALPVFLRGIMSTPSQGEPAGFTLERRACLDGLVALGDSSIAPALRGLAAGSEGERFWSGDRFYRSGAQAAANTNLGQWAVAALAACGDRRATRTIRDAVAAQGVTVSEIAALRRRAEGGGSLNDFPRGFWSGGAILYQVGRPEGWASLASAYNLLSARPEARGSILRAVARDPALPDAGRVVALSEIDRPTPADLDSLGAIWRRALAHGPAIAIPVPNRDAPERSVTYNVNACAVAYALGRWSETDRLVAMLPQCPPSDSTLAPEILHALTWTEPSPAAAALLEAYVRDAWNRAAARPAVLDALAGEAMPAEGAMDEVGVYAGLDLPYRVRRITRALCGPGGDAARLRGLISDPALAPALRLHWMMNVYYDRVDMAGLADAARSALDQILAAAPDDRRVAAIAEMCRARIADGAIPVRAQ